MGDCYVATVWTMLVLMFGVLDAAIDGAFVPMVFVLMVQMPIVHVIEMIVMGDSGMTAIGTMNVGMLVLHRQIMAYVLVHALVISHDLVGKAALTDEFGHSFHRCIDMSEKGLESFAQIIQSRLTVGSFAEAVFWTASVAGKAHIAVLAHTG